MELPARTDWERIRETPWGSLYIQEVYWLARENVELCDHVFRKVPAPETQGQSFMLCSLLKERRKRRDQSSDQYEIQQARVRWLQSILEGVTISELLQSKVRHSLEHFDELLDEAALTSLRKGFPRPTLFASDVAIGHDGTLEYLVADGGSVYPLRVYLVKEKVFINCGRRIDIGAIASESASVAARILAACPQIFAEPDASSGERGSTLFLMKDESYDSPA